MVEKKRKYQEIVAPRLVRQTNMKASIVELSRSLNLTSSLMPHRRQLLSTMYDQLLPIELPSAVFTLSDFNNTPIYRVPYIEEPQVAVVYFLREATHLMFTDFFDARALLMPVIVALQCFDVAQREMRQLTFHGQFLCHERYCDTAIVEEIETYLRAIQAQKAAAHHQHEEPRDECCGSPEEPREKRKCPAEQRERQQTDAEKTSTGEGASLVDDSVESENKEAELFPLEPKLRELWRRIEEVMLLGPGSRQQQLQLEAMLPETTTETPDALAWFAYVLQFVTWQPFDLARYFGIVCGLLIRLCLKQSVSITQAIFDGHRQICRLLAISQPITPPPFSIETILKMQCSYGPCSSPICTAIVCSVRLVEARAKAQRNCCKEEKKDSQSEEEVMQVDGRVCRHRSYGLLKDTAFVGMNVIRLLKNTAKKCRISDRELLRRCFSTSTMRSVRMLEPVLVAAAQHHVPGWEWSRLLNVCFYRHLRSSQHHEMIDMLRCICDQLLRRQDENDPFAQGLDPELHTSNVLRAAQIVRCLCRELRLDSDESLPVYGGKVRRPFLAIR